MEYYGHKSANHYLVKQHQLHCTPKLIKVELKKKGDCFLKIKHMISLGELSYLQVAKLKLFFAFE